MDDLHASGPSPVSSTVPRDFCPFLSGVLTPSLTPLVPRREPGPAGSNGQDWAAAAWSMGRWRDSGWWRVIAGENRECACALAWLNAGEALGLLGEEPEPWGELIVHEVVRRTLAQALADHNAAVGSAARIERPWPERQEGLHDAVRGCCDPGWVRVELALH
jgi:hypothetical protein